MDISKDVFAQHSFGKVAYKKIGSVPENFRLYKAGWLGEKPEEWTVMEVVGAKFRVAKRGKNAGKMCIKVNGTDRRAFVTRDEIDLIEQPAPG